MLAHSLWQRLPRPNRSARLRLTTWLVTGAALFLVAAPGGAQQARRDYWKDRLYPFLLAGQDRGFVLGGRYEVYAPVPYDLSPTNAAEVTLEGFVSTTGYRALGAHVFAPAWIDGWRLRAAATIRRDGRFNYVGLGNEGEIDAAREDAESGRFYDAKRTLGRLQVDVQRRVVGALRALVGVGFRRTTFTPFDGTTQLGADLAGGVITDEQTALNHGRLRAGLVWDSRDLEVDPRRGVWAEALVEGNGDYTRVTGHVRGYVAVNPRLRFAGRVAGERIGGTAPFGELFVLETSELPVSAVGGHGSHRAVRTARYAGPGKLLASSEVRYSVLYAPSIIEVALMAFLDGGRVFDRGFRLTVDGMHWGGGGGLAFRFGRNALVTVTVGTGPDGLQSTVGTGWSY